MGFVSRLALDAGRCQRNSRLAHLRRLRPALIAGAELYKSESLGRRSERNRLRARRHHHRSLSVVVSVGAISPHQGGGQAAHAAGPARQHPHIHPYFRWQAARRERARHLLPSPVPFTSWTAAISISSGFYALSSGRRFLRHSRQIQSRSPASLFSRFRSSHGVIGRSDHRPQRLIVIGHGLSGPSAASEFH